MHVINTLFPIFAVIALGALLRRKQILTEPVKNGLNKIAYTVGLPCLLFSKTAGSTQPGQAEFKCIAIICLTTFATLAAAYFIARALKIDRTKYGSFMQAAYRGNNAYVGLQLVYFAFLSQSQAAADQALSMAAIALGPVVILYNILSVWVLTPKESEHDAQFWKSIGNNLRKNPLIIGIMVGVTCWFITHWTGHAVPVFIDRSVKTVGQIALPAALLCVGFAMADPKLYGHASMPGVTSALIRVVISPLLGLPIIWLLRADPMTAGVSLLILGCPTALASYVLVDEMNGDKDLTAAAITASTGFSLITLSIIIAILF